MNHHKGLAAFESRWLEAGLSRRRLMKLMAAGAAATAVTEYTLALAQEAGADQVAIEWKKPRTLGPLFATAGSEQQVIRALLGTLVKMNASLEQVGDLADYEVSDDFSSFTFTLKDGVTFSDGEPLTTADVEFTLMSALNPASAAYWQGRLAAIRGASAFIDGTADTVEGIEVVDEKTITLNLENPDTAFLITLADFTGLGILPKHVLESVPADQLINDRFNLEPSVGAGPYKFVQYATDQYLEMDANEEWVDGAPAVKKIFLRIVQPDVALAEMEKGTLDLAGISLDDIERVEAIETLSVISVPSPSLDSISVNNDRPYFQDKRVRQAMMHAIDRKTIVEQMYKGMAVVRNSPIFGPDWMGVPEGLNEYEYDPEKATQLLTDAGWDPNQEVEMMYVPGSSSTFDNMVPVIQSQWEQVGIKCKLLQLDGTELNQKLVVEPDYDLYIGGGGVYAADPSICAKYYYSANVAPAGANNTRFVNEDADALFEKGRVTADQEERVGVYTELAKLLNDECPSIYLWSPDTHFAVSNRLQGFEAPGYRDNRLYDVEKWTISS